MSDTRWDAAAYAYAALVLVPFGYILYGVPIQVTDSYGNLVQAMHGTLASVVYGQFYQHAYLRPLLWGHLRFVYDLSGGHLYEWYRGWHVAQVAVLFVLFVRLVRPRTAIELAAVPLGLAALIGIHTFAGTVREAFPINTFMTILLCCFAAADLALGPPRWWRSAGVIALFVFAALTVETGVLVAVIVVAAWLAGARGVSRSGVAAVVLLTVGYFVLRFLLLRVGAPALDERPSGFGFSSYEPSALIKMFGGNPLPFYAYNVLASGLSLLFAEPSGGVFRATRALVRGPVQVGVLIGVVASVLGTGLIARYAWHRRSDLIARRFDRGDQLLAIFVAVALANIAMCYAYTKDVILSPAGAFFAVVLAVAAADYVDTRRRSPRGFTTAAVLIVAMLSTTWAFRAVGIHVALRDTAATMRNEWAYVDQFLEHDGHASTEPDAIALKRQLQRAAIWEHPAHGAFPGAWTGWFEE